ncbi:MAG: CehA/McbA family metallohydrolase [Thermoanaerobacteraceae bacterium]|nr:CehA/McbA family metallohydrolase [Thermoanaerobacteraceae bacterium]
MLDYEYVGNLHVHSTYSDGTGDIADIVKAARKASVDFIGLNDHHTLGALKDGYEGWHDGVLLLVGMENNHNYHHYLSYGVTEEVPDNTENPQEVIDHVNGQGGIGFIAHPFEKGSRLVFGGHAYTWNNWAVKGFTGICVWNYSSQWRDGATSFLKALYQIYLNPHYAITGACPRALAKLDEIARERKVVAIGGTDAHAVNVKYGPFTACIFPYEFLFRTVNTHVLLAAPLSGDLNSDKIGIYGALRHGHCFVAFDYYFSANGFRFWAENGRELLNMGDETRFTTGWQLRAKLPGAGEISVIHNGQRIHSEKTAELTFAVRDPGVYRLEVRRRKGGKMIPWIYSNFIYFR